MTNIKTEVKGNTLTITIDLSKRNGLSSSGKSEIVATTSGNVSIGDVKLGLNCYIPVK